MTTRDNPPLPHPPFYSIPNINNLRDAALLPLTTASGARIRPGILFRSAEVSKLDASGWQQVHALGIAHVFDLRSAPEVAKGWAGIVGRGPNGDGDDDVRPGWLAAMQHAGVQRTWAPVFAEADYSPERLAERYVKYMGEDAQGFVEAYEDILKSGGDAFRTILLYLADLGPPPRAQQPSGALVHCTAGKDRTGVFFGVLFDFLGVPRVQIADEYNLTEVGLRHVREDVVARLVQSPGFKKYALSQWAGEALSVEDVAKSIRGQGEERDGAGGVRVPPEVLDKGRQAALRMVGARRETMLRGLEMVDRVFGGAEAYMRNECGLSAEQLESLRKNLVLSG